MVILLRDHDRDIMDDGFEYIGENLVNHMIAVKASEKELIRQCLNNGYHRSTRTQRYKSPYLRMWKRYEIKGSILAVAN